MATSDNHYQNTFTARHIGPSQTDIAAMLESIGQKSLDTLIEAVVPSAIRSSDPLTIGDSKTERELLDELKTIADQNILMKSYLGMGYHDCITPPVIQRNILENPGWYTQYTPYQAEISQGRLEALLNYQTMVCDLTALPIANASLLDEATAAAEAMAMTHRLSKGRNTFLVSNGCHPQVIAVVQTRAEPLGININLNDHADFDFTEDVFGCLVQYPDTSGSINNFRHLCSVAHEQSAYVIMASDIMSLTLLTPPGELGADVAVGSTQRFGVPMGYGGPHAAYFAVTEQFKRLIPGRLIGVSADCHGQQAYRMALQTREQHIRRERATSNICTAQVLLAIMSGMYAIYHGPQGIRRIAEQIHQHTCVLATSLTTAGYKIHSDIFFDTIRVMGPDNIVDKARGSGINIRDFSDGTVGIALDETVTTNDLKNLLALFNTDHGPAVDSVIPSELKRKSAYLTHPVFNSFHSETEMLRYIHRLETKDLSLNTSMIPLGSCTMKLNATTEMVGVTWPEFGGLHPFAPQDQAKGYKKIFDDLIAWLADITGLPGVSLQPNSGAQGEYAGLMVIRAYHESKGNAERKICLIPESAHGTNPASAIMCGMKVIIVKCDRHGNIDFDDLKAKAKHHEKNLAALMITYPSTHGVFENSVQEICDIIHESGGQVYMDGANLNAMVGISRVADIGVDVCHINLHKTFAIPHGGGGPGMGPICTAPHLTQFLPSHPVINNHDTDQAISAVSAAPWGSAGVLPISWCYMAMLGSTGMKTSTAVAILNANYMAKQLEEYYPVLYKGENGLNAHEFIIDLRPIRKESGITDEDVAKRLMDYGFHAPTMSWPVAGTLMIEPTESESKTELDRFCTAMISIKDEITAVAKGAAHSENNVLKNAPHIARNIAADTWDHPYSRIEAVYPAEWLKDFKYWPPVGRIDNASGDRNLVCTCPDIKDYENID
ncbi:MAG: aminomethyl-transferring glycine dehydrogenase [Candidatus Neomarinimicrobiota bacterium]|nr:aminomethyl-transferring glycine dehydrogenase [Candidatus Neomarinimicrobiota bacterium]